MRTLTDDVPEGAPPGRDRPDLSGPDPGLIFGRLFESHAAALRHYLVRRIGESAADDVVNETFLVALNQRHRYDPARAAVRSWLYGIATNLIIGQRDIYTERGPHFPADTVSSYSSMTTAVVDKLGDVPSK